MSKKRIPSAAEPSTAPTPSSALSELLESCVRATPEPREPLPASTLIGVVEDTHHPDLPGRVFCAWTTADGDRQRRWLTRAGGTRPRVGDRVLLTRPGNDPEWVLVAVLASDAARPEAMAGVDGPSIRLEAGEPLTVLAHDGAPLLELSAGARGFTIRPLVDDLELDVPGRLSLAAERLELRAEQGGVDIRTEADVVARGRFIRLN